ncbi:hypothetical protein DVH05_025284 [Phytophthora capsici]|nr:hypothetical protein DVH05_025284 [Phytophthora capsici]
MDFLADVDFASLSEAIDLIEPLEINDKWLKEGLTPQGASSATIIPPPAKKKRTDMRGYSTRLLHRKKAELASLRNEEAELTAWLEQLKNSIVTAKSSSGHEKAPGTPSNKEWVAKALEEFRRRKRAEAVNRKLKAIQADQAHIQKSLLNIIQHKSDLQVRAILMKNQIVFESNFCFLGTTICFYYAASRC